MSEAHNNGRQILIDIIEDFNPEKFVRFFREKNRSFAPRKEELSQYNDENFRNGIKLGEISFTQDKNPPLPPFDKGGMGGFADEKMLVCAFEAGQPLSERSGKKAQYEKGKKVLKESQSDAGIFIFYDSQGNFRFSLIYANYLGTRRDWSAFRRFTYFVSKEYTNKTFLLQIGEEDFSSLNKIKEAFSVEKVTKDFFTDIANWYFWVVRKAEFPKDAEVEENGRNIAVIRMITRLIFIWFMKERGLIRQNLFNYKNISTLLKDLSPKNTTYYKAILQNLFFATLNTKIEDRKFRFGKSFQGKNKDYMDHGIYRYEDYFKNKEDMLVVFKDIPFLNGGLFDCLDRRTTDNGKNVEIRIDGFTDKDVGLSVPNLLFFSDEISVDLNTDYGTKNKKYKVRGLMDTLSSYNFTIDENDPNDADVALDPELLGKVFENLLASFNPETATTARKQTGSFYTPREIVNYMVDESLIAYLSTKLDNAPQPPLKLRGGEGGVMTSSPLAGEGRGEGENESRVRQLFVHTDEPHQFNPTEVDVLINAIDSAKILDPACGSGAFPMGILHKLVHALGKLDPDNSKWRELQKQKAIKETEKAFNIGDKEERIKRLFDIDDAFENNSSDYGRKLFLIENCIFGVDIQPIAVQIAKLRFFISLLVDQNVGSKNIRPLPNLETKFVAANTLIGIERPAQGLLRNPEIDRKEAELHRVRERHFTARMPRIKQKCIDDDKRLRAEISDLLKKDGFPAGVTEKLANWNPYDQNASADFFDPEWMFGIQCPSPLVGEGKGGFDVVIGNPPYVQIKQIPWADRKIFEAKFVSAVGRFNLFYFFLELTGKLARESGISAFIVPDRLLLNTQCDRLRRWLLTNQTTIEIDSFAEGVFEAVIDSIIVIYKNTKNYKEEISVKNKVSLENLKKTIPNTIPINYFLNSLNSQFDLSYSPINANLLTKIKSYTILLGDIGDVKDGIIQSKIPDVLFLKEKLNEKSKKLLFGKDIIRYTLTFDNNWVNYDPVKMKKIEIQRNGGGLRLRKKEIFERKKILTRQTADEIIAAYDVENYYYSNTLHGTSITNPQYNPLYVLALLNSRLMTWYYRNTTAEEGKVFAQIKIELLKLLPIKIADEKTQQPFITLVAQILAAKKKDPSADTSALEKQIDEMVYVLYGLTPEEIAIVGETE